MNWILSIASAMAVLILWELIKYIWTRSTRRFSISVAILVDNRTAPFTANAVVTKRSDHAVVVD